MPVLSMGVGAAHRCLISACSVFAVSTAGCFELWHPGLRCQSGSFSKRMKMPLLAGPPLLVHATLVVGAAPALGVRECPLGCNAAAAVGQSATLVKDGDTGDSLAAWALQA